MRRLGCVVVADWCCFSSVAGFSSDVIADEDDADRCVDVVAAAVVAAPAVSILGQYAVEYGSIECVRLSKIKLVSVSRLQVSILKNK